MKKTTEKLHQKKQYLIILYIWIIISQNARLS